MFRKLVVGMDFSENSERAVGAAVTFARATGAQLVLVNVLAGSPEMRDATEDDLSVRGSIEQRMRELSAKLAQDHGVRVDYGVVEGVAAAELVRYVEVWGGDLLVVGSAGRSGLGRILVGSVAEALVQQAPVPVLVIGPRAQV
jgi:nucleotide-binding universal stress UspA family protein